MSANRDDFSPGVKRILAHRSGYCCSKPSCRAQTAGPSELGLEAISNVGVAAHITGAAPGGPRFDPSLSTESRASVENGIWLCQTHAKEIDDDSTRFTAIALRTWKRHAEEDARIMLGKPISAQAIEISIQVSLHRADDESIAVIGATNLPNGTKLLVTLTRSNDTKIMGQGSATVLDGLFFSGGFVNKTKPHAHAWYSVRVFAGFNQPWNQPAGVIDIVGREGERLIGRFAELAHPEFAESEKRFRAVFDCVAPPLLHHGMPTSQPPQTKQAVDLVRNAFLEIEDEPSVAPVGEVVNWFMSFSDLREADGWQVRQLPNGSYLVSFSYLDGENSATAEWIAILESSEVRYANLHGKYMSHLRD